MSVYIRNTTRRERVDVRGLRCTAETLLDAIGERGASVALSLVGDAAIRRMNRAYRGKDRPTDVLSFPLEPAAYSASKGKPGAVPERLLGDVVISVDTARRQAAGYDASLDSELKRLLIHGVLHLVGHDHHKAAERTLMEAEERRLAAAIGLEWPY
jgi:probable rRNA maturation factor